MYMTTGYLDPSIIAGREYSAMTDGCVATLMTSRSEIGIQPRALMSSVLKRPPQYGRYEGRTN